MQIAAQIVVIKPQNSPVICAPAKPCMPYAPAKPCLPYAPAKLDTIRRKQGPKDQFNLQVIRDIVLVMYLHITA